MSRAEIIGAALKALDFELRDDGYHLSLPAPLLFSFDSDVVASGAVDTLTRVGRELRELGIDRALVRGHTDNVGSNDYNLALSKRRADAVAKVLVDGGYPAEKIDAKGLGSSVPIAENATAEGRSKNRRVVIIVQLM
jgi:outer membrane protein OmpA-like peptidoglycan-associated protein